MQTHARPTESCGKSGKMRNQSARVTLGSNFRGSYLDELAKKCKEIEKDLIMIRASKASRNIIFQVTTMKDIREMKDWSQTNA